MKIYVGADHRGYVLKNKIIPLLQKMGHTVEDAGSHQKGIACDYPKIAFKVGRAVARSRRARGILICMSGIGHTIAANKIKGVYAALCYNKQAAVLSREHNNANVLVLGSRFVTQKQLMGIIKVWLRTDFAGGRHLRRVNQIKKMEKE
jgi:RpiB/LacA/LacB family sugar-phosphate isomerase